MQGIKWLIQLDRNIKYEFNLYFHVKFMLKIENYEKILLRECWKYESDYKMYN